jgi:hypothetical protein
VSGQVFDAGRVVLAGEQGHQVVGRAPDVRLAHCEFHALVEQLEHVDRVGGAALAAA